MKTKIKYRTTSIVIGILSLVSFALGIGSFFLFASLGEGKKEEAIYSLSALGTLLFLFLFLILGILFIIFTILKKKDMKKYEAENKTLVLNKEAESEAPIDDSSALYIYFDDKRMKLITLMKGRYLSSPLSFYILLICMIGSYFLLFIPFKTKLNGVTDWVCIGILIALFTYLFFFIYFIIPISAVNNAKKCKVSSTVYVFEDKIVIKNASEKSGSTNSVQVVENSVIPFDKMTKAKKDTNAFYFNYLDGKGKLACLIITYEGIENCPISFLDKMMNEINHRK